MKHLKQVSRSAQDLESQMLRLEEMLKAFQAEAAYFEQTAGEVKIFVTEARNEVRRAFAALEERKLNYYGLGKAHKTG